MDSKTESPVDKNKKTVRKTVTKKVTEHVGKVIGSDQSTDDVKIEGTEEIVQVKLFSRVLVFLENIYFVCSFCDYHFNLNYHNLFCRKKLLRLS